MRGRPGAVLEQRPVRERAEVDLVELGNGDARHVPAGERELQGLERPCQLRGHAQRDLVSGDLGRESTRLLDSLRRQAVAGHGARREPVAVRERERVPSDEQLDHGQKSSER